ncbi:lysine acetyltransferase [Colletotrichum tofieldiae]|uniref:Lysine acetyltransferase (GNAT family protein) n=1 Tax=Colletotrichum tofieldiae TaxID=708197 RepID=A0A166X9U2_9PEZI|nr:lysine acetyltransferase (GNAT family protein) [Colletotrichum tofieldiae]GKT61592.1 lysine acetyltransferase [Colletotrichum tofieldiae]GKT70350.1 lysine acetyltransferase [Colletotrichum tofieldiae]
MGSTHETDLVLAQPTPAERVKTYTSTYTNWGTALELEDYIRREEYMTTVPVSRNGGITQWILTDPSLPPDARPILSSCESIRKRVLVARPDGAVVEAITHAVGSVFTDPAHRGNGYASVMMGMIGSALARWQGAEMAKGEKWGDIRDGEVACSVLYSDIGKKFYAKHGWHPYESTHLEFPPQTTAEGSLPREAVPLGYHELAELCAVDERLLRAKLATKSDKTRVSLLPDIDAMLWHLMREDYMTKHIFGKTPTVRGGVVGEPGSRVWAVWTRGYYGGLKKPEGNTMHILRLAIEDEASSDQFIREAIEALLKLARAEAAEWKVNNVEMWNPDPRVRDLIEKAGIPHEFIERERDSIASLMWYGDGEVEWVLNEKFGWC